MMIEQARRTLSDVLAWHAAATQKDMFAPVDADAFPVLKVMDAIIKDDHFVINNAFRAVRGWLGRNAERAAEISEQTGKALFDPVIAEAEDRFSGIFVSWEDDGNGMVSAIPLDAAPTARRRYHSLGDAAMNGGIAVSVFNRPVKAVDLYNGTEALAAGPNGLKDLKPVGKMAEYRVAILDGRIVHPPAWPAQLLSEIESRHPKPENDNPEP